MPSIANVNDHVVQWNGLTDYTHSCANLGVCWLQSGLLRGTIGSGQAWVYSPDTAVYYETANPYAYNVQMFYNMGAQAGQDWFFTHYATGQRDINGLYVYQSYAGLVSSTPQLIGTTAEFPSKLRQNVTLEAYNASNTCPSIGVTTPTSFNSLSNTGYPAGSWSAWTSSVTVTRDNPYNYAVYNPNWFFQASGG